MTWEEQEIIAYLKSSPKAYYSPREISRRAAGKKAHKETPNWAKSYLPELVKKGYLETDGAGHFRVRSQFDVESNGRKWVSPQIASLLKKSNKDFSEVATTEIQEDDV